MWTTNTGVNPQQVWWVLMSIPIPVQGTNTLISHPKDEQIILKYLAQGHKCHNWDSNPHSSDQKHHRSSMVLLNAQPHHTKTSPFSQAPSPHRRNDTGLVKSQISHSLWSRKNAKHREVLLNRNRLPAKNTLRLHCCDWCQTRFLLSKDAKLDFCLAKKVVKQSFLLNSFRKLGQGLHNTLYN